SSVVGCGAGVGPCRGQVLEMRVSGGPSPSARVGFGGGCVLERCITATSERQEQPQELPPPQPSPAARGRGSIDGCAGPISGLRWIDQCLAPVRAAHCTGSSCA